MSDRSIEPPEQAGTDEYLGGLFEKYQLSRTGAGTSSPRRRTSRRRRSSNSVDESAEVEEFYSAKRVEGIDWALIERLELQDGRGLPNSTSTEPTEEEVSPSSTDSEVRGDGAVQPEPTVWIPPDGMARSKSGTGPSRYDPRAIGAILEKEMQDRDWQRSLATGVIIGQWEEIVGDVVAQHCPVDSFRDGKLVIQADSTAWAQNLKLLLPQVMRRIDEEVGPGIVESVVVLPPRAPSWSHGGYRVPGRGPRDTYG